MSSLSIVIPLFNEQPSLAALYERLAVALRGMPGEAELIFVDDGSSDGSFAALVELAERDARVRPLRLRAHCGKAAALRAGFESARGDVVVTMDADLQDDPAELPRFVARIEAGCDLVSGRKQVRRDGRGKVLTSRVFNRAVRAVFGVPLQDVNCGYKAYRRELLDHLRPYGELHRYIPVFAQGLGARIGEIDVRHAPRPHGRSRYGLARLPKALLDLATVLLLTRYRDRPLHFFAALVGGLIGSAVALVAGGLLLACLGVARVTNTWLWGVAAVTLVLAAQLLAAGLLAEQRRAQAEPRPAALFDEYVPSERRERRVANE
jgi:glycosyltransferase involved in cell wall biosynthesis